MRVIGAGFGRTGTLSFKRALEDLGFGPTYHMQEVMRRPSHIDRWLRYARTGEVDWDGLFSGFGSGVDYPVRCVWDELASHFPDAKVVLTVRDPQQWWASTASTIYRFRTAFPAWMLRSVPMTRHWVEMTDRLVWDGLFDGRFTDRDHAVAIFERHIEHVRATCPPRAAPGVRRRGWLGAAVRVPRRARSSAPVPSPERREGDAACHRRGAVGDSSHANRRLGRRRSGGSQTDEEMQRGASTFSSAVIATNSAIWADRLDAEWCHRTREAFARGGVTQRRIAGAVAVVLAAAYPEHGQNPQG